MLPAPASWAGSLLRHARESQAALGLSLSLAGKEAGPVPCDENAFRPHAGGDDRNHEDQQRDDAAIAGVRGMDVEFPVLALGDRHILVKFVHLPRAVLEIDPFLAQADRVLFPLRTIPRHAEAHIPHGI